MYTITEKSIGEAWKALVKLVEKSGIDLADEGKEILNVSVQFRHRSSEKDIILDKFADKKMIKNMEFVFFNRGENVLGHSYADLMMGPLRRNDYTDIVELLREKSVCKRATLTFAPGNNGKVPCINVINFLLRNNELQMSYFARGQDAYKKFFADAVIIAEIQKNIANELSCALGTITGFIASAHNYYEDQEKINILINEDN